MDLTTESSIYLAIIMAFLFWGQLWARWAITGSYEPLVKYDQSNDLQIVICDKNNDLKIVKYDKNNDLQIVIYDKNNDLQIFIYDKSNGL